MKNKPIARRQILLQSAAGTALIAAPCAVRGIESNSYSTVESSDETNITTKAEVLVIGGGTAWYDRRNSGPLEPAQKTVLIERGSQLGGTMTVGGVAFPGLFHAWGEQIISGIGWELVVKPLRYWTKGNFLISPAKPSPALASPSTYQPVSVCAAC